MGCWNGTCMISRLPILAGERVKLIFLHSPYGKASISGISSYCYADGILSPAFLPISGRYNDYGGIVDVDEDWNYKTIENILKNALGDKIKIKSDKPKENWTLADVIYGIERGRLEYFSRPKLTKSEEFFEKMIDDKAYLESPIYAKMVQEIKIKREAGPTWTNVDLSFTFIREDIYNTVVDIMKNDSIYTNLGNEVASKKYRYIPFHEYNTLKFNNDITSIKKAKANVVLLRHILSNIQIFNQSYFDKEAYTELLYESVENIEILESIFKMWNEFEYIQTYLNACRTGWMVQTGAGSQAEEWDKHKAISEKIIEICNKQMEE
jgi:hypothetical protein